jgi:hypothetical protein
MTEQILVFNKNAIKEEIQSVKRNMEGKNIKY